MFFLHFLFRPALIFSDDLLVKDFKDSFAIVLLPDTQKYKHFAGFSRKHIFESQTKWIVDHLLDENIKLVLHVGDIVDTSTESQWENAIQSLSHLEFLVPYVVVAGNHDLMELVNVNKAEYKNSTKLFNKKY